MFWPVVETVNFRYVPPFLRVTYSNVTDLLWAMVMSYLKHNVRASRVCGGFAVVLIKFYTQL